MTLASCFIYDVDGQKRLETYGFKTNYEQKQSSTIGLGTGIESVRFH